MGVLDKAATKRLIQPLPAVLGGWIGPLESESELIDRRTALNLAFYRSFLNVSPGDTESYFIFSNEKHVMASAMGSRTKHSVIRADADTRRVTCAAPGHGWFTSDWTLQAGVGQTGAISVNVVQHRMIDDSVPNSDLLRAERDGLARALAEGPGKVVVAETGFNLDQLVERRHLSTKSPFYADHLLPIPDQFQDGARIPLPAAPSPWCWSTWLERTIRY